MWGRTNSVIRYRKNLTVYQQIQKLVRQGNVQEQYALGDIIPVSGIDWQVVAFDVATPADSSFTHSMTLCSKDCIDNLMFDAPEPSNPDSNRRDYGNNRYAHSAIRQWLNSDKLVGRWWTAQHEYDAAPGYDTTDNGFLTRLDPDFLAVIGKTKIKVGLSPLEGYGYEELEDYFYLSSITELGLGNENNIAEGANYPYFNSNSRRKKKYNGSDYYYWCRTPYANKTFGVRCVNVDGDLKAFDARGTFGIVPVCNII